MKKRVLFLLMILSATCVVGQEKDFYKKVNALPAFTMFGDNYFITGPSTDKRITEETADAKFVLGFKQRLTNVKLPWNTFAFFTYRQKAFWNIYQESFPFRETNYNPALGLAKVHFENDKLKDGFWFSFEHESNGRDGDFSRSWNYFALQYINFQKEDWQLRAKVWAPIGSLKDNSDILEYRGLFEVGATWRPVKDLFFDADLRQAFTNGLRGSIKLGASYKLSKNGNQYVYLQYFGGYSEDLIDYNQHVSKLRIGIAFKDLFDNFAKNKVTD